MYTANLHQNQTIQNLVIKSVTDNSVVISGYASVYNISDQQNDLTRILHEGIKIYL